MLDEFNTKIGGVADSAERESLRKLHEEKLSKNELTIWLKDFPRTASEVQEMRRSAQQHLPADVEVAIHAAVLVEERFKRSYDEKPEVDPYAEITQE